MKLSSLSGSSSSRFDDLVLSISSEIQRFDLSDMDDAKQFIVENGVNEDEICNIIISDYYSLLLTIIHCGYLDQLNSSHIYLAIRNNAPYCLRVLTTRLGLEFQWNVCLEKYQECLHDRCDNLKMLYLRCIMKDIAETNGLGLEWTQLE